MSAPTGIPPRSETAEKTSSERAARTQELGRAFRQVSRALGRLRGRDTHLDGTELSHAQFQLLIELDDRGDLSAGQLAGAAGLSPGSVTQMLDMLVESEHVERVRSDVDRRVVVSRLTARGRRQVQAKRAYWQERWDQALDGVSERELRTATNVLARLGEMFEREAPAAPCQDRHE